MSKLARYIILYLMRKLLLLYHIMNLQLNEVVDTQATNFYLLIGVHRNAEIMYPHIKLN